MLAKAKVQDYLKKNISKDKTDMKKYLVRFTTKSGDYDKEWCYAENEQEASQNIQDEHWNIASIDFITEEK